MSRQKASSRRLRPSLFWVDCSGLKFTTQSVWNVLDAAQNQHDGTRPAGIGNHSLGQRLGWWTNPNYVDDLPGGPGTVHPLVTIENSETGQGGLNIKVGILQGICFNGSIVETLAGHTHLGKTMGLGRYSEETRSSESKTIMLKARDDIRAAFNPEVFARMIAKVRKSQEVPIDNPAPALDQIIKATEITESARDSILAYFIKDYRPTAYGLAQAISRHAQDVDCPQVSSDLEEVAGLVMVRPEMAVVV